MPNTLDAILIVAYCLVPGYLFTLARQTVLVGDKRGRNQIVLESIAGSMVFWAVFAPIVLNNKTVVLTEKSFVAQNWVGFWCVTALCLILPPILGLLVGWLQRERWFGKLDWLPIKSSIPKAWDYVFSQERARWVLVTLTDDTRVAGFFGGDSFASSYPNDEDLYIQQVHAVDENGRILHALPGAHSVWVPRTTIKFVEFKEVGACAEKVRE